MDGSIRRALVIAPHADDETFGCGGTIAKLTSQDITVDLLLGTLGYDRESFFKRERELCEAITILGVSLYEIIRPMEEGHMDGMQQVIFVSKIEDFIRKREYDAVFIPYPSHHQDHIVIHQACLAALRPGTFQPKMILMYEYTYPTWVVPDQYNGRLFVDISDTIGKKMEAISAYKSQLHEPPNPVSVRAACILALARGLSIGVANAEMFYVIQMKDIL